MIKASTVALVALLSWGKIDAFAPRSLTAGGGVGVTFTTSRSFGVDPSFFQDVHEHIDSVASLSSSFSLADAMSAVPDAMSAVPDGTTEVVDAGSQAGWFGFLAEPIEGALKLLHSVAGSWGVSIILMTLLIKGVTFPLTKTQLEGTSKMQVMQPLVKELQAKYQSNPEVMNKKVAELYQSNDINPLAGCIPAIVQIPVFIGLYRAVLNLAKEDLLNESFLFLPNLEGPTYGADPTHGMDWLMQGWVNGVPALGWADTASFLIMPVLLVVSQFASVTLMQPKGQDAASSNAVLKLLPLMIGWFSLSAPSALSIYWLTNNIVTTSITLAIKNSLPTPETVSSGGAATAANPEVSSIFAPPREKPAGFGSAESSISDVKPITSVVEPLDAEIVDVGPEEGAEDGAAPGQSGTSKKRGKKRKKRRK